MEEPSEGATLVQGWFRVFEAEPGIVCIEEPLHEEQVKSYLVVGDRRALLIDTGMGIGDLRRVVDELTRLPVTVIQSHAHFDHIGGAHQFVGRADILIHPRQAGALRNGVAAERMRRWLSADHLSGSLPAGVDPGAFAIPGVEPTGFVKGGESFDLGGRTIETLDVPGHCPGLLAMLDRAGGVLWSTDAAYAGPLYAHLPDSELGAYRESMAALAALVPALRTVYPAHGATPIAPSALLAMRDALEEVAAGRAAAPGEGGVVEHEFSGFSVLVRPEMGGSA